LFPVYSVRESTKWITSIEDEKEIRRLIHLDIASLPQYRDLSGIIRSHSISGKSHRTRDSLPGWEQKRSIILMRRVPGNPITSTSFPMCRFPEKSGGISGLHKGIRPILEAFR